MTVTRRTLGYFSLLAPAWNSRITAAMGATEPTSMVSGWGLAARAVSLSTQGHWRGLRPPLRRNCSTRLVAKPWSLRGRAGMASLRACTLLASSMRVVVAVVMSCLLVQLSSLVRV